MDLRTYYLLVRRKRSSALGQFRRGHKSQPGCGRHDAAHSRSERGRGQLVEADMDGEPAGGIVAVGARGKATSVGKTANEHRRGRKKGCGGV
jgi:hypothetical protein